MKVAYDISVLGQGYVNPKAKTGVYRVVNSLLIELLKIEEIELNLIALNGLSNIWDEMSCILFIEHCCPELKEQFQSCWKSYIDLSNLYLKAVEIQKSCLQFSLKKVPRLYKASIALQIPFKFFSKAHCFLDIESRNIDIYHSLFYSLPSEKILNSTQKLITIYDLIPILNPQQFTETIYHKFCLSLDSINIQKDWVICISENTKKDFCEYTQMNPKRVFVTPLAAGEHFYPITNQQTISNIINQYKIPNSPYLLSLCTLEPRKNLSFLIRCFVKIVVSDPTLELNLVLVGVKGWKNTEIFETVKKNPQLNSRIIFTGYIPDEDLSAIYSGATAFVYPSLYEGFGLPPLEAMQCGTPVITSNTSSLPEVVGDAGIMINPTQEDELCQAILDVINDSQLRQKLSQKGLERSRQFSWKKCAEETVKVYKIATENKDT
ncbi:glycosyl transferase group 1 [Rippkaea orientalis PCC 8801]|uniref:Glycosyl transferase group 1 n=1 Tax=Rippkaea orientalis (strain PCC 8801 / RF-1) TaxID=41431 RepID=B7JZB7_RIPO1|nr:glycosyltransferase family 1 protein [Rippkaea orientalis]ACK67328.1 glycosyl transferase group 1 [Rippkaea orientalis PCC 8801]